jgi:hypothetical protein
VTLSQIPGRRRIAASLLRFRVLTGVGLVLAASIDSAPTGIVVVCLACVASLAGSVYEGTDERLLIDSLLAEAIYGLLACIAFIIALIIAGAGEWLWWAGGVLVLYIGCLGAALAADMAHAPNWLVRVLACLAFTVSTAAASWSVVLCFGIVSGMVVAMVVIGIVAWAVTCARVASYI